MREGFYFGGELRVGDGFVVGTVIAWVLPVDVFICEVGYFDPRNGDIWELYQVHRLVALSMVAKLDAKSSLVVALAAAIENPASSHQPTAIKTVVLSPTLPSTSEMEAKGMKSQMGLELRIDDATKAIKT